MMMHTYTCSVLVVLCGSVALVVCDMLPYDTALAIQINQVRLLSPAIINQELIK